MIKPELKYIVVLFSVLFFIGCKSEPKTNDKPSTHKPIALKLIAPEHEAQYDIGDEINFNIQVLHPDEVIDLTLHVNDSIYQEDIKPESQTIKISTVRAKAGWTTLFLTYKDSNGNQKGATRNVFLFSDIVPEKQFANILQTFSHNEKSYTQGLEFYNGKLYESTGSGDYSQSFLAEVDLATGNIIKQANLENRYFGEGITILNDTIYQLTWRSHKCFMYNMDFEKIGEFNYEDEGWGLCNNGKSLIMTNGTSKIVWRNPRTFEIEKYIYAVNNMNDINQLNEIELINGNLFINVYTENFIIEVDTTNGKVINQINCSDLVKEGRVGRADVLNGIAQDPETGKIYMTGKLWPSLFEVEFE